MFAPCLVFAEARRDPVDLIPARQLWGLVVRCERAIRDISPYFHSQKTVWGQASYLLESIAVLSSNSVLELVEEDPQPPLVETALGRLLVSSAASGMKASQMLGIEPAGRVTFLTAMSQLHRRKPMRAWAPTLLALLLPRVATAVGLCSGPTMLMEAAVALSEVTSESFFQDLQSGHLLRLLSSCFMSALVHQTVACARRPVQVTRSEAHIAVGVLSNHAHSITKAVVYVATYASDVVPADTPIAAPSDPQHELTIPLREQRLVVPLLHLIHSPLLDLLAVMQHVPVEATSDMGIRHWRYLSTSTPPVHDMLSSSTDPDASNSRVAMQVGACMWGVPVNCRQQGQGIVMARVNNGDDLGHTKPSSSTYFGSTNP